MHIIVLCTLLGASGNDGLEKLRSRILSYAAEQPPSWLNKSGWVEEIDGKKVVFGVAGTRFAQDPREETSQTRLNAILMSVQARARSEVSKTVSTTVTQEKGQGGSTTRVQSNATISGVQIVEMYLSPDHKDLYALAKWTHDEESLRAGAAMEAQVMAHVNERLNAPCKPEPWTPTADEFDARAKVSLCLGAHLNVDFEGARKDRPWVRGKKSFRQTNKKTKAKYLFAVGKAKAKGDESSSAVFRKAVSAAYKKLGKKKCSRSVLDVHVDKRDAVWALVGCGLKG